ncbi:MAG: GDSL-type esterase/lipase family protein [Flavitalea sp.]
MHRIPYLFLLAFCSINMLCSCSQENRLPFAADITGFEQADKASFPPANAIVFVGSSSFTMWKDVADYFPGYTIINRGFGGSTLNDVIRYTDKIIVPYKPKQIVIYCGDNDIAAGSGSVTSADVLERFVQLFTIIRKDLPSAAIAFVAIKPSPSREKYLPIVIDANNKIKDFLSRQDHSAFIDVYYPMLDAGGKPRKELFLEDMLHMKPAGYVIWQKEIQPFLLK